MSRIASARRSLDLISDMVICNILTIFGKGKVVPGEDIRAKVPCRGTFCHRVDSLRCNELADTLHA